MGSSQAHGVITGATGPAGASGKSRTLWFSSAQNNVASGQCLGHQEVTAAACPSGTAASFIYNYQAVSAGTLASLWAEADAATGSVTRIWTVSVLRNGTSVMSCTVSGTTQTACETSGSVALSAGDFLQVTVTTGTGNAAAAVAKWKTYVTIGS